MIDLTAVERYAEEVAAGLHGKKKGAHVQGDLFS
jgi:hypothetical protein